MDAFFNDVKHLHDTLIDMKKKVDLLTEDLRGHEDSSLLEGLQELGVSTAFPGLRGSPVEPQICMNFTQRNLRFVGHGARKWKELETFEAFLGRLSQDPKARVDFLLNDELDTSACDTFIALEQEYPAFSARVLLEPPLFRMVELDSRYVSIQAYPDRPSEAGNWDLGGIIFSRLAPDSMFPTFSGYISRLWRTGVSILEFGGHAS